ncbi:MAG: PaaI family thioesterase [Alphaproteobacteria bacterium]|nr:PaaI family thioesterase [Alphaproteobacteria bacterium]
MAEDAHDPIQQEPITGFQNLLGYRLVEWREGHAVLELDIADRHRNRSGVLHGGVIMTMIDAAGGFSGTYCAVPGNVRRGMSLSISTNFTGQATDGIVRAVARRTRGGRKIFFASVEVFSGGELIGTGEGVYRYRGGYEDPRGKPMPPPARGSRLRTDADG